MQNNPLGRREPPQAAFIRHFVIAMVMPGSILLAAAIAKSDFTGCRVPHPSRPFVSKDGAPGIFEVLACYS
jgi:hypothetical protein